MKPFRVPNAKRIDYALGCGIETARAIRSKLKAGFDWSPAYDGHVSHGISAWLREVEKLSPSTYGVESLHDGGDGGKHSHLWYFNTGDPYNTTLVFNDETDCVSIACWGDFFE